MTSVRARLIETVTSPDQDHIIHPEVRQVVTTLYIALEHAIIPAEDIVMRTIHPTAHDGRR